MGYSEIGEVKELPSQTRVERKKRRQIYQVKTGRSWVVNLGRTQTELGYLSGSSFDPGRTWDSPIPLNKQVLLPVIHT